MRPGSPFEIRHTDADRDRAIERAQIRGGFGNLFTPSDFAKMDHQNRRRLVIDFNCPRMAARLALIGRWEP